MFQESCAGGGQPPVAGADGRVQLQPAGAVPAQPQRLLPPAVLTVPAPARAPAEAGGGSAAQPVPARAAAPHTQQRHVVTIVSNV